MPGGLVRRLTVVDGIAIGVGSVIGVGIFRTTGEVLRATGAPLSAVLVWVVIGLVNVAGASAFGRVAVRIPEVGGPYAYVREALGRRVAFVDGWLGAGLSIPARQAAQLAILGEVLAVQVGGRARVWSLATLLAIYLVHLGGVYVGARVQRALTAWKLVLIASAVIVGFVGVHAVTTPDTTPVPSLPLGIGLAGAFYTYLGWQDVTHLSEELREPERTLPRVLVATVAVVMTAYVAWVLALTFAFGGGTVARSDFPVRALALGRFGARGESVVTWGMFACMVGAVAEGVLVRPRLWLALARDRIAPQVLLRVDGRGVAREALTLQCGLMAILVASGSFAQLLVVLALAQAVSSSLEAASALLLERRWGRRVPVQAGVFALANLALAALLSLESPSRCLGALVLLAILAAISRVAIAR
jgi:APA family basic amino acid/polyamine antiporter